MPNLIDTVVNYFAPRAGLARARARYATRIYDAATVGRRGSSWRNRNTSANAEIQLALRPLRDRCRELVRNTPHAGRMVSVFVSNTVGVGLRPVADTGSDGLDKRVLELWQEWQETADVEGVLTFAAQQALAVHSMIETGEVVLRFIDRRPDELKQLGIESPIPLQTQLLEADFIDQWREGIYGTVGQNPPPDLGLTPDTKRSRLGVGLGEFDRRTGLWLYPWHPGEVVTYNIQPAVSRFHPRPECLHIYRPLRPGQVRGVPWLAPVMTTARDLSDFMDAMLVKARVEACFAAFVVNPDEFEQILEQTPPDQTPEPVSAGMPTATMSTLEPGMIQQLRGGQDIKFAQPTTTTQVEPVLMHDLMAMAAGAGVTYDQLTGDLRQANYSSLRAGKLDFRRLVEQIQAQVVIPMLCKPVWDRFIKRAILGGQLRDRSDGYPAHWVTPAWESVNPKFDLEAELHSVRAGRLSPQDFIASWGNDWRKVVKDWAEFKKACDENELVFDINAWQTNRAGQTQKTPEALNKPPPAPVAGAPFGKKPNGAAPANPKSGSGAPNGSGGESTSQGSNQ